jgi:hypothetical protein
LVWYVSYGSNMCADRLTHYLCGGTPEGGRHRNPGARNDAPPRRSVPVDLPGSVYFAGESPQWGGGVAFYDHDDDRRAVTAARAYLVTAAQFADIAAQEMHRVPQHGDPLEEVVVDSAEDGLDGGRHEHGPGRYETLIEAGRLEGAPLLLFTSPHGMDAVEHTHPSAAYLDVVATGLRESRGWDDREVAAYLRRLDVA